MSGSLGQLLFGFSWLILHLADVYVAFHLRAPVRDHRIVDLGADLGTNLAQDRAHVHFILAVAHLELLFGQVLLHLEL